MAPESWEWPGVGWEQLTAETAQRDRDKSVLYFGKQKIQKLVGHSGEGLSESQVTYRHRTRNSTLNQPQLFPEGSLTFSFPQIIFTRVGS